MIIVFTVHLGDSEKTNDEAFMNLLTKNFSPPEGSEFDYSGKCSYCKVEIGFSDVSSVKIIKRSDDDLVLYHIGCHERYLRRTID